MEHPFLMFLEYTQRRSTFGRTPLDEWSARRRDLYLTTHDTHNRQISMPPVGFEPKILAGERPAAAHLLRSCSREGGGRNFLLGIKRAVCEADHTLDPLLSLRLKGATPLFPHIYRHKVISRAGTNLQSLAGCPTLPFDTVHSHIINTSPLSKHLTF